MEKNCQVLHILFSNLENGYTVFKAEDTDGGKPFTAVGSLFALREEMHLVISGDWTENGKYGRQFVITGWSEIRPSTLEGIRNYLCSGIIPYIGPKMADLIVRRFGEDTFNIIENMPQMLKTIPGIGSVRAANISASLAEQRAVRDIMVFLQGIGVSTAYAMKIYATYGADSIRKVSENPYILADEIDGIGFKIADKIALKMGYPKDGYHRKRSGILYQMNEIAKEGHCYLPQEEAVRRISAILELEADSVAETLDMLTGQEEIIEEDGNLWLPKLFFCEVGVSRRLADLIRIHAGSLRGYEERIRGLISSTGIDYDGMQRKAILESVTSQMMVLTGGPGTGKTTTVKGIITVLEGMGMKILLAAPTGRASKRMQEATGRESKTLHRLLEFSPSEGFKRDQANPLSGDALIIDESSMVDIMLMHSLLKAVPTSMRLILVGDVAQLPSVGPGNVLRDIIDSGIVNVIRLENVHRQALGSRIVTNSHRINHGEFPDISNGKSSDFFFIRCTDGNACSDMIRQLVSERLPRNTKFRPRDIQVLTPKHDGSTGVVSLNTVLQECLNPSKSQIVFGSTVFRPGDRVMQMKNNYKKEVFNGDVGYICYLSEEERKMIVDFSGSRVEYDGTSFGELSLAYCSTIHKSQGSEYPCVIIPVTMADYYMLQRNLIYTAVTRAKKYCILVGEERALGYSVGNNVVQKRNTRLRQRLIENLETKS